jgi:phosphohistidine swiveling domain-containing protein
VALTAKARSIEALARIVRVPPFVVVGREATQAAAARRAEPLAADGPLIVRGCTAAEDGERRSLAGASPTIGPVDGRGLARALARVLDDPRVVECIVQRHIVGPSGVAFSLPGDDAADAVLVEWSAVPEGVTAGRLAPFAALLPGAPPPLRALEAGLRAIVQALGHCNVEFVGLDEPAFVQARPITAAPTIDRDFVRLKAALQELPGGAWEHTEYCIDLAERPERDAGLLAAFLEAVPGVYSGRLGRTPALPERPFLKVGRQLFASLALRRALALRPREAFRLGLRSRLILADAEAVLDAEPPPSPARLAAAAFELNLLNDALGSVLPSLRPRLFALRERCRAALDAAVPPQSLPADVPFDRRLSARIVRDDARMCWTALGLHDGPGTDVVPGDFDGGRRVLYERDPAAVPAGCVLVTDELYPELAGVLDRVAAIVCEGGGYGSHLAILARERRVPLRIQAAGAVARAKGG